MTIDHDEWAKLYIDNPVGFEQRRRAVLAEAIDAAPEHLQQGLMELQADLDRVRAAAATPLQALAEINKRMLEQMLNLQDQMIHMCQLANVLPEPEIKPAHER